jgi:hypothetical protein
MSRHEPGLSAYAPVADRTTWEEIVVDSDSPLQTFTRKSENPRIPKEDVREGDVNYR